MREDIFIISSRKVHHKGPDIPLHKLANLGSVPIKSVYLSVHANFVFKLIMPILDSK